MMPYGLVPRRPCALDATFIGGLGLCKPKHLGGPRPTEFFT